MRRILVTGSTGFVGSHLCERLEYEGHHVIGASRHQREAAKQNPRRSYRHFDALDSRSAFDALEGVNAAVYLIHSMADQDDFLVAEEKAAHNFVHAAATRGLERIVYLGGVPPTGEASTHLRSRMRVGEVLRAGSVPCIELQASMVIGAGSESFTMVRDLAARLPVLLMPNWAKTRTDPVGLDDILAALVYALEMPCTESEVLSVPGPDVLSIEQIVVQTSRFLGFDQPVRAIPLVTPALSARAISLLTRANSAVARELVEGLTSDLLASAPSIWSRFHHKRTSFVDAVRTAIAQDNQSIHPLTHRIEAAIRLLGTPLASAAAMRHQRSSTSGTLK